jgi:type VI secretion system secreted protein VgrG
VQFYWDREPKKSCPVRVAQSWAGKGWGEQFIPRTGMEVVVEFLEGDPDRPLVTGCVYNGGNKVTYTLPGQKTQSGLKSDSTKGHNGYNEFMFEDKKDHEFIRMHAQKDHDVTVLNSETWTIGKDRTATLKHGDDKLTVDEGNRSIWVHKGRHDTTAQGEIQNMSMRSVRDTVKGITTVAVETDSITMTAPLVVQINSPTVIISGNLWVQGGIFMSPMALPVT